MKHFFTLWCINIDVCKTFCSTDGQMQELIADSCKLFLNFNLIFNEYVNFKSLPVLPVSTTI